MTPLPTLRPQEVLTIFKRIGYAIDHPQGSHAIPVDGRRECGRE